MGWRPYGSMRRAIPFSTLPRTRRRRWISGGWRRSAAPSGPWPPIWPWGGAWAGGARSFETFQEDSIYNAGARVVGWPRPGRDRWESGSSAHRLPSRISPGWRESRSGPPPRSSTARETSGKQEAAAAAPAGQPVEMVVATFYLESS